MQGASSSGAGEQGDVDEHVAVVPATRVTTTQENEHSSAEKRKAQPSLAKRKETQLSHLKSIEEKMKRAWVVYLEADSVQRPSGSSAPPLLLLAADLLHLLTRSEQIHDERKSILIKNTTLSGKALLNPVCSIQFAQVCRWLWALACAVRCEMPRASALCVL